MAISPIQSVGPTPPPTLYDSPIENPIPAGLPNVEDRLETAFHDPSPHMIRPKLPISVHLASLVDEQDALTSKGLTVASTQIRNIETHLAKTKEAIMTEINDRRSKEAQITLWGTLGQLAGYLTSAASLITGGALIATGTPQGIISGGLLMIGASSTMTGLFLSHFKNDPKLTGTLAILGAGLSMMGGVLSWNTIPEALREKSITTLISSALGIMNGISMVGRSVTQSQLSYIDKLLMEKKEAERESKSDIERVKNDMKSTTRRLTDLTKITKETLESLEKAKRQILQT